MREIFEKGIISYHTLNYYSTRTGWGKVQLKIRSTTIKLGPSHKQKNIHEHTHTAWARPLIKIRTTDFYDPLYGQRGSKIITVIYG